MAKTFASQNGTDMPTNPFVDVVGVLLLHIHEHELSNPFKTMDKIMPPHRDKTFLDILLDNNAMKTHRHGQ